MESFWQFLRDNASEEPLGLLLAKNRWPDIDVALAVNTLEGRRRMQRKVPSWAACERILYPTRLCTEQCSSEETACYKAVLASRILGPGKSRIADLTGGLGVDSWAFSRYAEVLYNEADPQLARAAGSNFASLQADIRVRNESLAPGRIAGILGDFPADLLYLDPARRAESGRKVFRLADCRPDILSLLDELLEAAPHVLVKLSPMADIAQLAKELGPHVREIVAVSSQGECKELLVWLDRFWQGDYSITAHTPTADLIFTTAQEHSCPLTLPQDLPKAGDCLLVPDKAVTKAACFKWFAHRYGLTQLGLSTHLYLCDPGTDAPGTRYRIGRVFPCSETKAFRGILADVTARNLPMTSEELARRLGIKNSGRPHIWGLRVDLQNGKSCRLLLETEKLA